MSIRQSWRNFLKKPFIRGIRHAPSPPAPEELKPCEEVVFEDMSGGTFSGLFLPADGKPKGTILCCHPMLGDGRSFFYRNRRMTFLREAGFNVFAFDFNGFGNSAPGGLDYSYDVNAAIDYLLSRKDCEKWPIGLMGLSFGGYQGLIAMARTDMIDAAVIEGVFQHLYPPRNRWAPLQVMRRVLLTLFPETVGAAMLDGVLPQVQTKALFFITGEKDTTAPPEMMEGMARKARVPVDFLVVPGSAHLDAIKDVREQYESQVVAFFEQHFNTPRKHYGSDKMFLRKIAPIVDGKLTVGGGAGASPTPQKEG